MTHPVQLGRKAYTEIGSANFKDPVFLRLVSKISSVADELNIGKMRPSTAHVN